MRRSLNQVDVYRAKDDDQDDLANAALLGGGANFEFRQFFAKELTKRAHA